MFNVQDTLTKITSCTNRSEKHGKEREPAISIGLSLTGGGEILDQFDVALRPMLYRKPQPKPGELPMDHDGLTELRFPFMRSLRWDKSYTGYLLRFHIGATGSEDVLLAECEIKEITFVTQEGGSVEVTFKVNAHPKDDEDHGKIGRRVQQIIGISLTPPDDYVDPGLFGTPEPDEDLDPFEGSDLARDAAE
ncbi:hypothetical protein [Burkholderia gladioli]|uniref:hypothetical protein n=1 Tax=Burkholderia gladioli TaxID=28095 RepID=UPI001C5D1FA2|nr:hypothetical protein [Burkholderia gladioli]MBW5285979.1 hypothetical protein [Burkholderia gladioli]